MRRITEVYAWVAATEDGTEERIIYSTIGPVLTALVTTDRANLPKMRDAANIFVQEHRRKALLLRTTAVQVDDVIEPPLGAP